MQDFDRAVPGTQKSQFPASLDKMHATMQIEAMPRERRRVTLPEAAEMLGLAPATLRSQVRNHRLRTVKYGRDHLVTLAEIERYRAESRGRIGRPEGAKDSVPRKRGSE